VVAGQPIKLAAAQTNKSNGKNLLASICSPVPDAV
jgi:hypothetical protein